MRQLSENFVVVSMDDNSDLSNQGTLTEGELSTVDLLVLTSLDQPLLILLSHMIF